MRTMVLAFLVLVAWHSLCEGAESGNNLKGYLEDKNTHFRDIGRGYVLGVADAMPNGTKLFGYSTCIPPEASKGQLGDVVLKWLQDHPQTLHFSAASLVASALQDAFPCDKQPDQ